MKGYRTEILRWKGKFIVRDGPTKNALVQRHRKIEWSLSTVRRQGL
jgi:hypothetical protein